MTRTTSPVMGQACIQSAREIQAGGRAEPAADECSRQEWAPTGLRLNRGRLTCGQNGLTEYPALQGPNGFGDYRPRAVTRSNSRSAHARQGVV